VRYTWRTFADVFGRAGRLDAESAVLAVVVLADAAEVVLDGAGDGRDLAEASGVAASTHAPVAVDSVLARAAVLTDVRRAVVHVRRTVLARVAARTVAPANARSVTAIVYTGLRPRGGAQLSMAVSVVE